jgi:uncharacterized protein YecE (DUF72 family)
MKYYQDLEGKVLALDDDVENEQEHLPEGAIEISLAQVVVAVEAVAPAPEIKAYADLRLAALRKAREVVLNRLMGTMVNYSSGQAAAKLACVQARLALLELPQHKDLLAAQTPAELDAAIDKHQVDIQAALPEALHRVFTGVQL